MYTNPYIQQLNSKFNPTHTYTHRRTQQYVAYDTDTPHVHRLAMAHLVQNLGGHIAYKTSVCVIYRSVGKFIYRYG